MKRLFAVLATIIACVGIRAEDVRTYLRVGGEVCAPILVKCSNGSTYKVYDEVVIEGLVTPRSATDCQGRDIVIPLSSYSSKSGEYHYRYYEFKTLYGSSSSNTYNNNGSYNRSNSSSYNAGQAIGQGLGSAIFGLGGGNEGKAYPALRGELGLSRTYGEFVRFRYSGHGFNFFAGIGKNFMLKDKPKDKILWHTGIGSYFAFGQDYDNPLMDIGLAWGFSNSCQNEGVDMTIDIDYTCWIGKSRRVGIFGGAAIGWANFVEAFDLDKGNAMGSFGWNMKAGLTIRLARF